MSNENDDEKTRLTDPSRREEQPDETVRVSSGTSGGLGTTVGGSGAEGDASVVWLGRYRVIEELGRGGQAVVYLARDEQLGREVALKVLRVGAHAPEVLKRFQREAAIVSGLDDPGICAIYDGGVSDGVAYIAMQLLRGPSLKVWLQQRASGGASSETGGSQVSRSGSKGRRRLERLLAVIEKIARSLHTAHEAGVVHRDIKPANVMITEGERPVIVDFGLASATDQQQETLTVSGDLFGTPLYMSPEQVRGERMDARTDVYSLGVVLYETLTGRRPFEAATREGLYRAILEEGLTSIRSRQPDIPRDLEIIVATAMEKDLRRRYQTAGALADDIRRFLRHEVIRAKPMPPWVKFWKLCQRNALASSLIAFVFVLLFAGLIFTASQNRELEHRRQASERATYRARISAAWAAFRGHDTERLRESLDAVEPERRGWEWRYLDARIVEPLFRFDLGVRATQASAVPSDDRFLWIGRSELVLLDAERGRIVRRLQRPGPGDQFEVSPDGKTLLIELGGLEDPGVMMIDAVSGEPLWPSRPAGGLFGEGAFSPDGREVVIRDSLGATVLDSRTGEPLRELRGSEEDPVTTWQFLTADVMVAARHARYGRGSAVSLRDAHTGALLREFPDFGFSSAIRIDRQHGRGIFWSNSVTPEIAATGLDPFGSLVTVIDAKKRDLLQERIPAPIPSMLVGEHALASCIPGGIELRSLRTGAVSSHLLGREVETEALTGACGGTRVVTHDSQGHVAVWPARAAPFAWSAPTRSGTATAADEGGERQACTNWGLVTVTSVRDGGLLWQRNVGIRYLFAIAFSPDGTRLALATHVGEMRVLDARTGEPRETTAGPPRPGVEFRLLDWSRDGKRLFGATRDGRIESWRLGDPATRPVIALERPLRCLLPLGDGRLAVGLGPRAGETQGGALALVAPDGGEILDQIEFESAVTALHAAADGRRIFAGLAAGSISSHDLADLRSSRRIGAVEAGVDALGLAPGAGRLLVGTENGLVLFDTTENTAVLTIKSEAVRFLRYLPDRDAILLGVGVHRGGFVLLETDDDPARTERRLRNNAVARVVTSLRDNHLLLGDVRDALDDLELPEDLRAEVERNLDRSVEGAPGLNSQAWAIAIAGGKPPAIYEQALRLAVRANELNPGSYGMLNTRSQLLLRIGRWEECLESIEESLVAYRTHGRTGTPPHEHMLRATCLAKLGRRDEARRELLEGLAGWTFDHDTVELWREALEIVGVPPESVPEKLRDAP